MSGPLADRYDLFLVDLDGVVYVGDQPVPGAVPALNRLRESGAPVAFATNNASRRPSDVAEQLTELGVPAEAAEVVTSAQATAGVLAGRLPAGAAVLVVGAPALAAELAAVGLRPVESAGDAPVAVVQGYGADVGWRELAEGSIAVRAGATWVATNRDATLPSPRGPLPGNGALVAALVTALGREPDLVVGKPAPTLFQQAARQRGARRALVIGDRLDTDIEGANRAGMHSVLVLTGVSRPADLLAAPAPRRPTHVAADLSGLFDPDLFDPGAAPGWRVSRDGDTLVLSGQGSAISALRELCAAAWLPGMADRPYPPPVRSDGDAAAAVLAELGLAPAADRAGAGRATASSGA